MATTAVTRRVAVGTITATVLIRLLIARLLSGIRFLIAFLAFGPLLRYHEAQHVYTFFPDVLQQPCIASPGPPSGSFQHRGSQSRPQ